MITSQGIVSAGVMEETPQPTLEGTSVVLAAANTLEPAPSKTPASFTFSSVPVVHETGGEESSTSSPLVDPNLLWGASAAAAALAATAYALSRKEEKEAERKRQEEQSLAEANAKVAASEATKTANYIAKRTLEDKLGIPITSDIVACSAGLKGLYQNIVNTILGNPTEEIDEDLLSEIGNDLARYFNDQPIENGGQTAPASVSWSEFVSTPVGPTLDDAPPAVDYSNLVSIFNQGEAASNASYTEYEEYHDKLTRMEELTEDKNVLPQPIITTPLPGLAASIPGIDYSGESSLTPSTIKIEISPLSRFISEAVLSLIPFIGDGVGVIRQLVNWITKKPLDEADLILSLVGFIFDLPFDGIVGDFAIAGLKGLNAVVPSGPAREVMTALIKKGIKNPDDLLRMGEISEVLLKNERLLQAVIENPKALDALMKAGPEAAEELAKYGDEAVVLVSKFGDNGLKYLMEGGTESFDNMKLLSQLDGDPGRIITDIVSGSPTSKKGALFQLEQIKMFDPNKISGVEVEIPGGRADLILTDGTIIDYKSWNWYAKTYQTPNRLQDIINKTVSQMNKYKLYQIDNEITGPIKLVFESLDGMPDAFKKSMEVLNIIIEVK